MLANTTNGTSSMTDWKPGDPLYTERGVGVTQEMFEFKSCDPDDPELYFTEARWTPDKGWLPRGSKD